LSFHRSFAFGWFVSYVGRRIASFLVVIPASVLRQTISVTATGNRTALSVRVFQRAVFHVRGDIPLSFDKRRMSFWLVVAQSATGVTGAEAAGEDDDHYHDYLQFEFHN
jgi:hypothetical protein